MTRTEWVTYYAGKQVWREAWKKKKVMPSQIDSSAYWNGGQETLSGFCPIMSVVKRIPNSQFNLLLNNIRNDCWAALELTRNNK